MYVPASSRFTSSISSELSLSWRTRLPSKKMTVMKSYYYYYYYLLLSPWTRTFSKNYTQVNQRISFWGTSWPAKKVPSRVPFLNGLELLGTWSTDWKHLNTEAQTRLLLQDRRRGRSTSSLKPRKTDSRDYDEYGMIMQSKNSSRVKLIRRTTHS